MAVLGLVDVLGGGAEYRNVVLVKLEGEIVRDLAAHGDNDSVRSLKVDDVHHPLEGELVEIEPVAHIVVCGDGLRVVVDQHSPVALLLDCLEAGHRAPVELDRRSDPVGSRAEDNHRLAVTLIFNVTLRAVVGQVEVVRLCREFGGEGVYLLDDRDNAERLSIFTNLVHIGGDNSAVLPNRSLDLEIGEAFLLGKTEKFLRHILDLVVGVHILVGLDDVLQLVQEPFVDLGEIVDLIYSVAGTHCLGDHEYTLVGRLPESLLQVSDLEFLVADESVRSLTDHSESFLDGLLEAAADGHNLADGFHRGADFA